MEFLELVNTHLSDLGGVPPVVSEREELKEITENDLPVGMPLTNRLDRMTKEQAIWVLKNGDAWLAYLRVHGGEVYAGESASDIEVSPADQFKAICETLNRVWWALVGERDTLRSEQIPEWIDTLRWAVSAMPAGYERHGEIIQSELERWDVSRGE